MANRPNILLIVTDQHISRIAGYNGDPVIRTNHLDSLAENSTRFDTAVSPSPLCTPARMCLLTGKEAYNCSAWGNHWMLFPEHVTWPQYFADNGYRTCLVGKMHFGGRDQMNGFQYRPYGDLRHGLGHQPEPMSHFPAYAGARSAGITEIPESLLSDAVITQETLSFLLEHNSAEADVPWFVCAGYTRPHPPFTAPGRYIRRYRDKVPIPDHPDPENLDPYARANYQNYRCDEITEEETMRGVEGYYACLDYVDDCIGELLNGLEKAGMLDNTIVIYTADHGEMLGSHGLWGKAVHFEPAISVPLLVRTPGVTGGAQIASPASLIDLFPTCCSLAELPIPPGLDGVDLSASIGNRAEVLPRDFVRSMYVKYASRIGNQDRLSEQADMRRHMAMMVHRRERWKYVAIEGAAPLLFDLEDDPGENHNLTNAPEHADRLARAERELFADITWDEIHNRIESDRKRVPEYLSGHKPSMPNQYMLPDGRVFDAETELYGARWLHIDERLRGGGIIPQQFG